MSDICSWILLMSRWPSVTPYVIVFALWRAYNSLSCIIASSHTNALSSWCYRLHVATFNKSMRPNQHLPVNLAPSCFHSDCLWLYLAQLAYFTYFKAYCELINNFHRKSHLSVTRTVNFEENDTIFVLQNRPFLGAWNVSISKNGFYSVYNFDYFGVCFCPPSFHFNLWPLAW